jgi:excisionase family DNA binding protein
MSIEEAAAALGVSRGLAYEAARRGEIPTIRLGRRLLVPRAKLLQLVGGTSSDTREQTTGTADTP